MGQRIGQQARFVFSHETGEVYGRHNVTPGVTRLVAEPRAGMDLQDTLREVKKAIWRVVVTTAPPDPYVPEIHDNELKGALESRDEWEETQYLTVELGSILDDQDVLKALSHDLELTVLKLGVSGHGSLLLIDEHYLLGRVRDFIRLAERCGDADD